LDEFQAGSLPEVPLALEIEFPPSGVTEAWFREKIGGTSFAGSFA
jgi:hypothetical protein